jgi:hypothetical protein
MPLHIHRYMPRVVLRVLVFCCASLFAHVFTQHINMPPVLHPQVKARLAAKKKAAEAAAAKKKSIAAAAAAEAKARAKKAGGKKDTSHWNQAPTR